MIFLTGATGFVGSALLNELVLRGERVRIATRSKLDKLPQGVDQCTIQDLSRNTDWAPSLTGIDTIVHMAARVHQMNDNSLDHMHEYRKTNVDGTITLAKQAAASGVRQFIFMSSIKVNGESSLPGKPLVAEDTPEPIDPYGITKWEAEQGLMAISSETGMDVTIIRPPLVYGPGVKGNFLSMIRWINKGVPLPLGDIRNKRSFVGIDNLVDLIITCIEHPTAANQTFLAGDGKDLSTSELLVSIGKALGKPARLIPVPVGLLALAASMIGKKAMAQRLCGSLQVDISKARELLGWTPPVSVDEGLRKAVDSFLQIH